MKIADLKQPYRRMAEYLAERNTNKLFGNKEVLNDAFYWKGTGLIFWGLTNSGNYPPITEEIKKHFPPDFDFSGEEIKTKPVLQMLDTETQKYIYTQLAKEGKFNQLPDTCEFSEAVELEVTGESGDLSKNFRRITGKFKGNYMDIHCIGWKNVKLPTPEIDFSQFNPGDILEITNKDNEKYYGLLHFQNINELFITFGYKSDKVKCILKDDILSISKLK